MWIPLIAQRNRIAREKLENIQHVPDVSPFSLRDPQAEEQRLVCLQHNVQIVRGLRFFTSKMGKSRKRMRTGRLNALKAPQVKAKNEQLKMIEVIDC